MARICRGRDVQCENGLDGRVHGRDVESLEEDLGSLLSIRVRVQRCLCQEHRVLREDGSVSFGVRGRGEGDVLLLAVFAALPSRRATRSSPYRPSPSLSRALSGSWTEEERDNNTVRIHPFSDARGHSLDPQQSSELLSLLPNERVPLNCTSHHPRVLWST